MAEKITMILGIICIGYFAGIAVYAGLSSKFPFIWAAAGIVFLTASFFMHRKMQVPAGVRIAGLAVTGIFLVCFIAAEMFIAGAMFRKPDKNLDYIIVLGAQVKGNIPSQSLKYRIEKAQEYLEKNPDTKAILSGGKGPGENISEAECMYRELVKKGIDESRLIKEDKSTNTNENIIFSRQLLEKNHSVNRDRQKIGIVTNNFHVFRGTAIAGKKMDGEIQGIPAKSNTFLQVNYLVREFLGGVKDKIAGNL